MQLPPEDHRGRPKACAMECPKEESKGFTAPSCEAPRVQGRLNGVSVADCPRVEVTSNPMGGDVDQKGHTVPA